MSVLKDLFIRKRETFYEVTPYIAEFWNTITNAPFTLIALWRLFTLEMGSLAFVMYILMAMCGVCSGIHHATAPHWTIVIDWIPISSLMILTYRYSLWLMMDWTAWCITSIAIGWFLSDQLGKILDPKIGHSVWHILAAFAIDSVALCCLGVTL